MDSIKQKYITEVQLSVMTNIALSTLRNNRFKRTGIPYIKAGRSIRYNLSDVLDYLESRKINTMER